MTSTGAPPDVRVEVDGDTAHVVLARPDTDNALGLKMACEVRDALRDVTSRPGIRAIVVRAEGGRFSVGGDLREFRQAPAGANLNDTVARPLHEAIEIMTAAHQPVVCAVHGAVGGGAFGLVLASDIVLATASAVFRLGYTGSGLSPDCGVTWFLPRLAGFARALDLMLTNRRFGASEALDLGLVSRVVDDGALAEEIQGVLAAMRRVPVQTLSETKRLARRAPAVDLHSQLEDEARTIGRIGDTADTREAIAAFLDKRAPAFSA